MKKTAVSKYMAQIGAKGGKASKRTLTPEQSKAMLAAREAKRAAKHASQPNQSLTVEGMRVEIAAGSRVAWVYIVGDEGVIITTQQLAAALRQIVETDGQQEAQP